MGVDNEYDNISSHEEFETFTSCTALAATSSENTSPRLLASLTPSNTAQRYSLSLLNFFALKHLPFMLSAVNSMTSRSATLQQ